MLKNYIKASLLLAFSIFCFGMQAQVLINEMSAANLTLFPDNYGKYEDWVELYNTSSFTEADLSGWHLSDNKNEPTKWQFPAGVTIPPGGYLVVFCSGRNEFTNGFVHAGFKITQTKNNPENITFSNAAGEIIDNKKVRTTQRHHAFGRRQDGSAIWGYTTTPTPGASNNTAPWYEGYAPTPQMDMTAGFYADPINVKLTCEDSLAKIRFTLTGNEPLPNSPVFSGNIPVNSTTVVKAVAYPTNPEFLPSFMEFNTYFINVEHTLPVVSVSGTQLLSLVGGNQSLRPFGAFEYFNTDKERSARVTGELNSHGQDSWVNDQRSIDWVSRDEMGINNAVEEVLFPDITDRDEFQRVILRAAGDDNYPGGSNWPSSGPPLAAHMRDAYTHNLAKKGGMDLDIRAAAKAVAYINGKYWGVYDLREIPDDHDYTDYNFGQGKYELQYLLTWGNTWAQYWTTSEADALADWQSLYDFIDNNDMADSDNFEVVKEQFNYGSLADYMIVNSFANASDWLNYNTGWWRGTNPDGGHQKWGYILWDLDATYAYYINYTGILDTSATAFPCNVEEINLNNWFDPRPQQHLNILKKLRDNPEFNQFWITRQADMMKSVFGCENMLSYLEEVRASIAPEMPAHIAKWGGTMAEWESNVERLKSFIERRCEFLPGGLGVCYDLTGPFETVLATDPPLSGTIKANTLTYTDLPTTTPFFGNIDLLLHATPAENYVFDHWEAKNHAFVQPDSASNKLSLTSADTIIAHFKPTIISAVNPVISTPQPTAKVFPTVVKEGFTVAYELPEAMNISIRLLDLAGKEMTGVKTSTSQEKGKYRMHFNATEMPPGVYFVQFNAGNSWQKTFKVLVIE